MKVFIASVSMVLLSLAGCTEQNVQPQTGAQSSSQPAAGEGAPAQPQVPVHNLSRVTEARSVTPEVLATIEVGKTTVAQLTQLLGETKPFTLGDGKQIYRYDLGKFIFGADGVLLRKHINP